MSAQVNLARLEQALAELPVIAILRGLRSEEAVGVVQALYGAGVRVAEVPLNSPDPFVTIRLLVAQFGVPNGMGFSADGRTLYLVDTLARTLLAYPVDPYGGVMAEPVVLSDFMDIPGKPDGMTVGPDGSLCFDDAGTTLFVSTSRMRMGPRQLADAPGAGGVFVIEDIAMD